MHIAAVERIHARLRPSIERLRTTLEDKAAAFADVIKTGRTHLMDATPVTLGQELSGHAAQLSHGLGALHNALTPLCELALGGTAVGTGIGTHPQFGERAAARIAELTNLPFVSSPNKFASLAGHEAMVIAHGAIKTLAVALMKVANDIRWMASGPRCGLGEIHIPANEPGSSIMPGKVNPTQAEALIMVCCQILGNDVAIAIAASQGSFELNVCKPVLIFNLLNSIRLLTDACDSFNRRCASGIEPHIERLKHDVERSLMLVTNLSPLIGYDAAARVAKLAHSQGMTLRQAAVQLGVATAPELDEALDPSKMVGERH
jgi:fumarate hydratase class II